jgi:predicted transcriptional regulator
VLPRGDVAEVRRHVEAIVAAGREGGVVAGMHSVGPDISVGTYDAVIDVMRGSL